MTKELATILVKQYAIIQRRAAAGEIMGVWDGRAIAFALRVRATYGVWFGDVVAVVA